MSRVTYVAGVGRSRFDLDCKLISAGRALPLKRWGVSYTLGSRSLRNVAEVATEVDISLTFANPELADQFKAQIRADTISGKPGRLIFDGAWGQRAACVKMEAKWAGARYRVHAAEATFALLDGVWSRDVVTQFSAPTTIEGNRWLDLPYDLPYDLALPPADSSLVVAGILPSRASITIYGAATKPSVRIGANRYTLDADVPTGGIVVIDGRTYTAMLTDIDGNETDLTRFARRSGGEGSGEYAFQKIAPGVHEVTWDRSFGFDVTIHEERGEPPCSL